MKGLRPKQTCVPFFGPKEIEDRNKKSFVFLGGTSVMQLNSLPVSDKAQSTHSPEGFHPLLGYVLSLEGGFLTPQVLNLMFATVRQNNLPPSGSASLVVLIIMHLFSSSRLVQLLGEPPNREVGEALVGQVVPIKRPNTLPILLAAICHFTEHERKDTGKTQEQQNKLNNVYLDGLTLLDKLAAKSASNLSLCVATIESLDRWRLPCSLLAYLPNVQNEQFVRTDSFSRRLPDCALFATCVLPLSPCTVGAGSECAAFDANTRKLQYERERPQAVPLHSQVCTSERNGTSAIHGGPGVLID